MADVPMDKSELDAAISDAAAKCDALVKELDDRTPGYTDPKTGKVTDEHPTEAQIQAVVRNFVTDSLLAEWEGKIEAEVRKRMKSRGWELAEKGK